ncbi:antibiotic biosynthesis monooxygenase [Bradyrhizobium sp. SSBR45G]|uniref:antibiotic biosynthesis monooxygenase n=1 Tax=unclassified Bradyrhizobium TaxID=2631580 RepID=UPI002342ACD5|nr:MULTISPECIES: antibiotic biosynthesis monooxygenase [unclassified Bradyrhizobium]GLH79311.1 antibiotic biosynthesis monooxygenase [Bradyrhizobium sp. SSBR45G]GLH86752.1 antibiotic biosynthesis monooxygenase [Bradyrhizobium sp. SSBR45R]
MLKRIWRGWTSPANADAYEDLLRATIFPGIMDRKIEGLLGIELLRRPDDTEVEFMTIMAFADQDAIVRFAGPAHETAVVPPAAQRLLSRYDEQAAHFELRTTCRP